MADDYIVDEVRRCREEQAAKHAFDVKAILAAAKRRQRRSKRKVVSLVRRRRWAPQCRMLLHEPPCASDRKAGCSGSPGIRARTSESTY